MLLCVFAVCLLSASVVYALFVYLSIRRPPRSTRTDTLFPYTTLFRSTIFLVTRFATVAGGSQSHSPPPNSRALLLVHHTMSPPPSPAPPPRSMPPKAQAT